MLLAGCGGKTLEPVGIGQTAAFTADGVSENPFTGKKTKVHMEADLTVDAVMQVRNTSVDRQASLLLVLARIKNNSKEPLSLRGRHCTLHTKSGKTYQGDGPFPGDERSFPSELTSGRTISTDLKELGSDMSGTIPVAFRIPYDGFQEAAYFAIGGQKLVQIKDDGSGSPGKWLLCESRPEVARVYQEYPFIK